MLERFLGTSFIIIEAAFIFLEFYQFAKIRSKSTENIEKWEKYGMAKQKKQMASLWTVMCFSCAISFLFVCYFIFFPEKSSKFYKDINEKAFAGFFKRTVIYFAGLHYFNSYLFSVVTFNLQIVPCLVSFIFLFYAITIGVDILPLHIFIPISISIKTFFIVYDMLIGPLFDFVLQKKKFVSIREIFPDNIVDQVNEICECFDYKFENVLFVDSTSNTAGFCSTSTFFNSYIIFSSSPAFHESPNALVACFVMNLALNKDKHFFKIRFLSLALNIINFASYYLFTKAYSGKLFSFDFILYSFILIYFLYTLEKTAIGILSYKSIEKCDEAVIENKLNDGAADYLIYLSKMSPIVYDLIPIFEKYYGYSSAFKRINNFLNK